MKHSTPNGRRKWKRKEKRIRRISEGKRVRKRNKCVLHSDYLVSLAFRPGLPEPFRSLQFLPFPFRRSCAVWPLRRLYLLLVFNLRASAARHGDFPSSLFDFCHIPGFSRAATPSFLPFFSRFSRCSFPCAYNTPPQTWIQFSTSHPAKVTPRRSRK